jgi:molecular chaperone DnaK (HSP70)
MTVIIAKNTSFPSKKSQIISTYTDNQSCLIIKVYLGERGMTKDNHFLGEFKLEGILPAPRGVPQIEVTFDINSMGVLKVFASEKGTKNT